MDKEIKLEPASDEITVLMHANEACREEACFARVPELADIESDREFHGWQNYLEELDAMDADDLAGDLDDCAYCLDEIAAGWVEDTCGVAEYVDGDSSDI